ncbi:hypothetical protein BGZ95_007891, partial [Linnemannia exigua]
MSEHPLEQLNQQVIGDDCPNSADRLRKRKLCEFQGIPKSKSNDVKPLTSNQLTRSASIFSQVSNDPPGDNQSVVSPPVIQ